MPKGTVTVEVKHHGPDGTVAAFTFKTGNIHNSLVAVVEVSSDDSDASLNDLQATALRELQDGCLAIANDNNYFG